MATVGPGGGRWGPRPGAGGMRGGRRRPGFLAGLDDGRRRLGLPGLGRDRDRPLRRRRHDGRSGRREGGLRDDRFGLRTAPKVDGSGRHAEQREHEQRHPDHTAPRPRDRRERAGGPAGEAGPGRLPRRGPPFPARSGLRRRPLGPGLAPRLALSTSEKKLRSSGMSPGDARPPLPARGHLVVPRGLPLDDPALQGGELAERKTGADSCQSHHSPRTAASPGCPRSRRRARVGDGGGTSPLPPSSAPRRPHLLPQQDPSPHSVRADLHARLGDPGVVHDILCPASLAADVHGSRPRSPRCTEPRKPPIPAEKSSLLLRRYRRLRGRSRPSRAISRGDGDAEGQPEVREEPRRGLRKDRHRARHRGGRPAHARTALAIALVTFSALDSQLIAHGVPPPRTTSAPSATTSRGRSTRCSGSRRSSSRSPSSSPPSPSSAGSTPGHPRRFTAYAVLTASVATLAHLFLSGRGFELAPGGLVGRLLCTRAESLIGPVAPRWSSAPPRRRAHRRHRRQGPTGLGGRLGRHSLAGTGRSTGSRSPSTRTAPRWPDARRGGRRAGPREELDGSAVVEAASGEGGKGAPWPARWYGREARAARRRPPGHRRRGPGQLPRRRRRGREERGDEAIPTPLPLVVGPVGPGPRATAPARDRSGPPGDRGLAAMQDRGKKKRSRTPPSSPSCGRARCSSSPRSTSSPPRSAQGGARQAGIQKVARSSSPRCASTPWTAPSRTSGRGRWSCSTSSCRSPG